MSERLDRPLHGVAVYNPDLLSKQELVAQFVARRPLLERLVEDLGRERAAQHHLIIGQRGMGKTTLLHRLRHAVEDDPELNRRWMLLTFPEEQYNVAQLSDLYLNCIDALEDALEQLGRDKDARALDEAVVSLPDKNEKARAKRALAILLGAADRMGKRLLLLVDNLDIILNRLKGSQWAIRELLSAEKRLLLIGASAAPIEATYKYEEPFYDFFQIHELKGLSEEETREVLRNLARLTRAPAVERVLDEDPARIRTLNLLAGGNPRTIVLLHGALAQGSGGDVRSDLERLLDQSTPLYKARFEAMSAQSQQIVGALATHWDPISAGELATIVRLDINAVSSQLNRLVQQGVVEKVEYHPASKTGFQIGERFFNIWYLMRASRRGRRRLIGLMEFWKILHGRDEIGPPAPGYLQTRGADKLLIVAEPRKEPPYELETRLPVLEQLISRGITTREETITFARETIRSGHTTDALALLDDTDLSDRFRPLREALAAIAAGTRDVLRRVAPEIRQPAEQLLAELAPELLAPLSPRTSPSPKPSRPPPSPRRRRRG